MEGLPLLPGYSFKDPTISKYHVSHCFDIKNGYSMPRPQISGIGKEPLDVNSVQYTKYLDPVRYDPSLTYGRTKPQPFAIFKPHFVTYDKKCLTFQAFFRQSVVESPAEVYRIRQVKIIYFLEDDSITVMEPAVENAGIPQGRLVKRSRIPKSEIGDFYHWKDFNVGIDVAMFGIVYHICNCDEYTKEYLKSQGVELNIQEEMPVDPYIQNRRMVVLSKTFKGSSSPIIDDKLRRFLEFDGKVLRFFAVWDDRETELGEMKPFIIRYYLSDDTIDIGEERQKNSGCDPFPLFLTKMKIPRDWKNLPATYPAICLEITDSEVVEYYQPKDFIIGNTLFLMARRFFIYDCDPFTRRYFSACLKIEQPPAMPVPVHGQTKAYPPASIPHHIGIGTPEDSIQSCFTLIPKPPRKDVLKYVLNSGKKLRYTAVMDWVHPEDKGRDFIIEYFLANSYVQVSEIPVTNSGIKGGRFLTAMLLPKPGFIGKDNPEYYSPADFGLGSLIEVFGHRFIITGADLTVLRYMEANPEKFSPEMVIKYRNHFMKIGLLKSDIDDRLNYELQKHGCPEKDDQVDNHPLPENMRAEPKETNHELTKLQKECAREIPEPMRQPEEGRGELNEPTRLQQECKKDINESMRPQKSCAC